jgi:hypothetical protein
MDLRNGAIFLAWIVLSIASTHRGYCQAPAFMYEDGNNMLTSNVMLNELSPRAFRHFKKNFSSVYFEEWTKRPDGYMVTFYSGDTAIYHIFYSISGRFNRYNVYYTSERVPPDLLRRLQYFEQQKEVSIMYATELADALHISYEVGIREGNMLRVVEVEGDGSVTTMFEYSQAP